MVWIVDTTRGKKIEVDLQPTPSLPAGPGGGKTSEQGVQNLEGRSGNTGIREERGVIGH